MTDPLLEVTDLRKSFGGITALDGIDVTVDHGITGLIGPNGAGKTTFFNCVSGYLEPDAGTVEFEGSDVTGNRTPAIVREGLVRTFQIPRELADMTVRENLLLAPRGQSGESLTRAWIRGGDFATDERRTRQQAREMAEFFELDHLLDEPAGSLSGGQRKLLELARVLLTDPEMVLLDEPLAGVNPTLERKILDRIHELESQGLTFLFVEHDIELIMEHCDHVVVMHQGEKLMEGPPSEVRSDQRVVDAYLGEEL
ncbi:ABC transporter ATP-binding protein [Halorubellus sp. JP-L1]|uniref:ABC transporter ATP-binding protein n=1 Tax=Halorubellus sp. JP-L1 TaxID=2715753 RepID=UPI001407BD7E|nr:ABC transporter ATP-binding protein [Halorubellus sp. JP-L1]NHN40251.1 ABC transporter ATP-binding protein [Halorubellus sp. JP-L1]